MDDTNEERYRLVQNAVSKVLPILETEALVVGEDYIRGHGYSRFKYKLTVGLRPYFATFPWIRKVWYADLKGGEFIVGEERCGKDIDLLILADKEADYSEFELEEMVTDALRSFNSDLLDRLRRSNFIEVHINDDYVFKVNSSTTPRNAILVYPAL